MIYSSYEFFAREKSSLHLLNLGVPPVSQEGEENNQTNTAYENCNWLASKTWSTQATSFFALRNLSSPLLNLGVPRGSQEGEERKICWIIRTNTAYKNCNWLASKTWSIQAKSFLPLKKISLHLLNLGAPPVS